MNGWILFLVAYFLCLESCSSCGDVRGPEDGDEETSETWETSETDEIDLPDMLEGEEAPPPCTAHRDCTDQDPCNGNEYCDMASGLCMNGIPPDEGSVCSLDPRRICLSQRCSESVCGDGFVDTGAGEFCEPPGEGQCDERCLLMCSADGDCPDDGNPCNGLEICNLEAGRCSRISGLPEGATCRPEPRALCLGGLCVASICGDGFVDYGGGEYCEPPYEGACGPDCQSLCGDDPDCLDDADICNGVEYCSVETSRCARRDPAADGVSCSQETRMICISGHCRDSICGDLFLDPEGGEACEPPGLGDCDGDCLIICGGDPDCLDDGQVCNGLEYCNTDTSRCSRGDPPPAGTPCDDGHPLTGPDLCDGFGECVGEIGCTLESAVRVSSGGTHTCAALSSGAVACWGGNAHGQLGDGTTLDRNVPTPVSGLGSGVESVSCGNDHSCALTAWGGVQCWGNNAFGQLGDGSTTSRNVPAAVAGLGSGVAALAAGGDHTCVLMDAGGLRCWGRNEFGAVGDGTNTDRTAPTDVSGLTTDVRYLAAGGHHTCALSSIDNDLCYCWGSNDGGQLGDGTTVDRNVPTLVVNLIIRPRNSVRSVADGGFHTCAVMNSGMTRCWGENSDGQLGIGTTSSTTRPTTIVGLDMEHPVLSAGSRSTCALLDAGGITCWGLNDAGQLGTGTTRSASVPGPNANLPTATQVSSGARHACGLLSTGEIYCWGENESGQLGDWTWSIRSVPAVVPGMDSAVYLSAGLEHTCAIRTGGGVQCWGANTFGQVGDGTTIHTTAPSDVTGLGYRALAVTSGARHTCAVLEDLGLRCWGSNAFGQLGNGSTDDRHEPASVAGITAGVLSAAAGDAFTCALEDTGRVQCWGSNERGALGDGTAADSPMPVNVSGLAGPAVSVTAGSGHACALLESGGAVCWGRNDAGQVGDGSTTDSLAAADVWGLGSGVVALAAGGAHTCALTAGGGLLCWGDNSSGQVGAGSGTMFSEPEAVSGLTSGVRAVTAGRAHTCALLTSGRVLCWGENESMQAGREDPSLLPLPLEVGGLSRDGSALAAGGDHTCALTAAGIILCWGSDRAGQVSGFFSGHPHPVICPL